MNALQQEIQNAVHAAIDQKLIMKLDRLLEILEGERKEEPIYIKDRTELATRFNCSLSKIDKVSAKPDFPKRTDFGWRTDDIEEWEKEQVRKKQR